MVTQLSLAHIAHLTFTGEFDVDTQLIPKSSRWVHARIDFATTKTKRQGNATTNRYAIRSSSIIIWSLACLRIATLLLLDTESVLHHQNLRSPSTSHPINPRTRRPTAHPLIPMLPSHSPHHPDQRPINRILLNPTISPVLTPTAISLSSRIRSNSRLGIHRRRPPATNPSSRPSRRSHRQPRYWAGEHRPVATAGRIRCDPDP